jgi:hypothetical protein
MRCPLATTVALVAVVLLAGCWAHYDRPAPQPPAEKPPIAFAVIGFGGSNDVASKAEDGCVMALLEGGFRVVDRAKVVAVLPDENDIDFSKVGKNLGVDLILDGGVARGNFATQPRLEPRLISAHSANVLGTAKNKKRGALTRELGHKLCADLLLQLP